MKTENKYRILLLLGLLVIFIIFLLILFIFSIIYSLIIFILIILFLVVILIELYLRIQHNIDNNRKFYRQIHNDLIHQIESNTKELDFLKNFLKDMNQKNEYLIKENREILNQSILSSKEHLIKENHENLDKSIYGLKDYLDKSLIIIDKSIESSRDLLNQKINQNQQDLLKSNRSLAAGIEELFGLQYKYHEESLSKIINSSKNKTNRISKK